MRFVYHGVASSVDDPQILHNRDQLLFFALRNAVWKHFGVDVAFVQEWWYTILLERFQNLTDWVVRIPLKQYWIRFIGAFPAQVGLLLNKFVDALEEHDDWFNFLEVIRLKFTRCALGASLNRCDDMFEIRYCRSLFLKLRIDDIFISLIDICWWLLTLSVEEVLQALIKRQIQRYWCYAWSIGLAIAFGSAELTILWFV